jgi:plasmid stabilization system protein ParE
VSYSLTSEAEEELADAASFCLQHFGPVAAVNFWDTFEAKAKLIAESPGLGTPTAHGRSLDPIGRYLDALPLEDGSVTPITVATTYWQRRR